MENLIRDYDFEFMEVLTVQAPYRMHEEYEQVFLSGLMGDEEEHPLWKTERIELRSVGIDIGSSTSHLMFSRLVLQRLGHKQA